MKITLSKSQWQLIGTKAGWIKLAKENFDGFLGRMKNQNIEIPDFIIDSVRNAKFQNADFSNVNNEQELMQLIQTKMIPKGAIQDKKEKSISFRVKSVNDKLYDLNKIYHKSIPINQIDNILKENKFHLVNEDMSEFSAIFAGRDSRAEINVMDELTGKDAERYLVLNWHKMEISGNYEINSYLS